MAHHKKEHHEEHIDEGWLVPYADLLTLLLALFIVLFATSSANISKLKAMSTAMQNAFGMMPPSSNSITIPLDSTQTYTSPPPSEVKDTSSDKEGNVATGDKEGQGVGDQEHMDETLEELTNAFKTYVMENKLAETMSIKQEKNGMTITLTGDIWFASASATIDEAHLAIAREVAAMIAAKQSENLPFKVIITGHTDNQPIHTVQFNSNWDLSLQRAVNFLKALMQYSTLDPAQLSAGGMGDRNPIDTNETPEGRQRNRRVEVFITYE